MSISLRVIFAGFVAVAQLMSLPAAANLNDEGDVATVDIAEFKNVDPKGVINQRALRRALVYFKLNQANFPNQTYISVIDYTKHASERRFHIIDLKSGKVQSYLTAHGKGSDPGKTGWVKRFSNREGSEASSIGYYRTSEVYYGKHGRSMRLEGLSKTNSRAYERAVVIHPADYVSESASRAGRSWGCPAVDPDVHDELINKLRGGSLIYAYGGSVKTTF